MVVVDDCSGVGAANALRARAAASPLDLRVLSTPVNGGPAVARNLGWRVTTAPVVAFVDDDVVPQPGWLAAGLAAVQDDASLGVVQGRTVTPPEVGDVETLPPFTLWRVVEAANPYFEACNIFYRRDALEAAGGFDEAIGWWGEDTALGWAVLERGWRTGFAGAAVAAHDVEARPVAWFVRQALNNRNVVNVAARFPGFRAEACWRAWAFRRRDALLVLAATGVTLAVARRAPLALVAALPYAWEARPPLRTGGRARTFALTALVDAASVTGCLRGSIEHRILVL